MVDLCSFCGGELPYGTKRRSYCKDGCRQAAYRNRKLQAFPTHPKHRVTAKLPSLKAPVPLYEGLQPYVYPQQLLDPRIGSNPDGSTPGALQGAPLTYDADGHVEMPTCLNRRKRKLAEAA